MMYKWNIDIYLKSGVKLECEYHCAIDNTLDVSKKIFEGKSAIDVVSFNRRKGKGDIFVMVGEVAAFDVYI